MRPQETTMPRIPITSFLLCAGLAWGMEAPPEGPADGQAPPPPPPDEVLKADFPKEFAQADADHDGHLSPSEHDVMRSLVHRQGPPNPFDRIDTDHSGTVSPAELEAFFAKRPKPPAGATPPPEPSAEQKKAAFDKADANHDGVLSREEFKHLPKPPRPPKPTKC